MRETKVLGRAWLLRLDSSPRCCRAMVYRGSRVQDLRAAADILSLVRQAPSGKEGVMKHFTCDKCGMPMEAHNALRIAFKDYDICRACEQKIFDGLQGKGTDISSIDLNALRNIHGKYP